MCVCVCVCACACARVRVCVGGWVCGCVGVCLWISWKFVSSQLRAASFTYFGEVLRCPHKSIVTITKVYIARNNIHVEIIRFHTN